MEINTKYHGKIQIEKKEVIQFEHGIPGFLEEKEFVILPFTNDGVFNILQSVGTPQLAFVVIQPFAFFWDYEFELDEQTVQSLQLQSEEDLLLYLILTLNENVEKTTANLKAPIIINKKKNLGKQVILNNTEYQTKHLLNSNQTEKIG